MTNAQGRNGGVTEEELQALCAKWQKWLRLQDWDVMVQVVRRSQMQDPEDHGECIHCDRLRTAQILLIDPVDYDDPLIPQDQEVALVHELLHLHFALFGAEDGSPQEIAQEQAIHAISRALVTLARGGTKDSQAGGDMNG